tara:strand:+ start:266 stop:1294 length:1029 start_codon:yes stop_codon:yes gene_type:complete
MQIRNHKRSWELIFQVALHAMVFVFYAFDREGWRHETQVKSHEVFFFLNYALTAAIINYLLLPKLLYRKKYLAFSLALIALLALVMAVEEGILEQIFFPDTRGTHFPGIFRTLTDLLPTITILTGFKFAWDALTKQRELEELQNLIKESELQFLKSQINPHFLFNNLNNIYALALEKSDKTATVLLKLSGVMRYMLYEAQAQYVPLSREVEQVENFIELSEMQMEERGKLTWSKELTSEQFRIAPLILSVFVENAFKHSLASLSEAIDIAISLRLSPEGDLHFSCCNNFGELSNTEDLKGGIGLQNVQKRLELLYPDQHELKINEGAGKYCVDLKLKLSAQS